MVAAVSGGCQARVMNLVLVITASRLVGGPGRPPRPETRPSKDTGRGEVTSLESAERNKRNKLINPCNCTVKKINKGKHLPLVNTDKDQIKIDDKPCHCNHKIYWEKWETEQLGVK